MRLVFILSLTLLILLPGLSYAEETASGAAELPPPSTYVLPFPGMLPDNPFYPIKMARDRIILFLINDSVKKAEFYLLQSDKRLQAGVYLWRENPEKGELALSTISKGENYFEQALAQTRLAQREGRDIGVIKGNLEQAARKHTQVLTQLAEIMPKEQQDVLQQLRQRTELFAVQAKQIN